MKATVQYLLLSEIAAGLVAVGCGSRVNRGIPDWPNTRTPPAGAPINSEVKAQAAGVPAATPPEQSQNTESVVRLVLDAHGFVPPMFIEGRDAVRWAISTRPGSNRELVMAKVQMAPKNEITVELLIYAHIGSTWALLGQKFRGMTDQEAQEMNNQILERLVK